MRKLFSKKFLSVLLASSMVVGSASALTGCGGSKKGDGVIKLDVYSQLANFSGAQTGWSADILRDKLGIELNIIPDGDSVFETRMESGNLGDLVVWGADNDKYPLAVKNNLLFNWEEDDLLDTEGEYIKKNMPDALKKNKELTKTITNGASDALYGFGANVALSSKDHESFFYTWDIRWDLYKQLGYPKVKNLDDYRKLLNDMQKINSKDDAGNKVYAVSLWPDWDDAMVMYVKAFATAYYGYDELALGLYDPKTGTYYDALQDDGPYLEILQWFNKLYQDGLIDPDSMSQTYDQMIEKVQNGGTLFSIFNYSGSLGYNTKEHTSAGKLMYSMKPEDASPIVYGMNTQGGDRIWSIGAKTEYPELCMAILNWLSTPEGRMTAEYGPKDVCWYYDENGKTQFTDLGRAAKTDISTQMSDGYSGTFDDGSFKMNNTTWAIDSLNPDSNGETFNYRKWESFATDANSDIEQDWRDKTGAATADEYMGSRPYKLSLGTTYSESTKSDELTVLWTQVAECIKTNSWKAIYAKTDAEYDQIVADMISQAKDYGYDECIAFQENEASLRKAAENEVKGTIK